MTDYAPTWLDEPYPLDHTITRREHYARKPETTPLDPNSAYRRTIRALALDEMENEGPNE